jgi:selenocysteine-specific elongation factor
VRQIAPPDTIGGGRVLDPRPRKHGPSRNLLTRLERLSRGEPPEPEPQPTPTRRPESPPEATEPEPLSASALAVERRLRDAGFEPPLDSELDAGDLAALREVGRATRVTRSLHYHPDVLADVRRRVIAVAGEHGGSVTLAQLRDELGTSRKFAQALLEHLDAEKVTIRRGDQHVVRRSALTG